MPQRIGEDEAMKSVEFTLNGKPTRVEVREGESLLDTLRNRLNILSVKDGCQPQGQCGCCIALVGGYPRVSCAWKTERTEGKEVETLEGITDREREIFTRSMVAAGGLQCGFCTPGIVMRAKYLLTRNPNPTRAEIAKAIDGNLCRCTGYVRVIDAIEWMARGLAGEELPPGNTDGSVGSSLQRVEGDRLTLGERPFVDDIAVEGLLHGVVKLSDHARAKVIRIDTSKAEALPGVVAVVTAKDVPGERWYGLIYPDWPGFVSEGEEVRCVGDFIAAVAADDRYIANQATQLIEVEYEVLEPVLDPEEALAADAPLVNPTTQSNRLSHTLFARGDVDAALANSAHTVSGTWQTQRIEHLFLEPESALAVPRDDGRLHLYTQGQGVFDDRRQVASFLGVSDDEIFAELVPNGGAFGGKEDMSIQPHAALLARVTGRPVRVTLDREQSIRIHPKRHPIRMHFEVGCDDEGRLTAIKARMVGDTGAYASVGGKVLERAGGHACGPYRVANVAVSAIAARTNNPPCGAMRGFGANQANFGIEGCMDLLAEKVGLDGWEMRWRNAVEIGDMFTTGQILEKSVGVKKTLLAVKDRYYQALEAGRAIGISCGIKNSGIGNGAKEWGKCRLVVESDGQISLYNGFTEMGQGLLTVLVQCAVEVTGISASRFVPKVDSTFALQCGQTTGSRGTLLGGRAVVVAAEKLAKDLEEAPLEALIGRTYSGDVLIDDTTAPGAVTDKIKTHTAFGYATQVCILDEDGRVDRFLAAHDVGRAINPDMCSAQVEGSVHMGLGFALTEELPCINGMPVTFKLRQIGVLRARDMPTVEVDLVEDHEPEGPFGAKGVGEIGLVPTAGAVAGALAMFDGVRRYVLPMKDSPAAKAMSVGRIRTKVEGEWH
jgi:selenium-dependent xanthine dehydrogenase